MTDNNGATNTCQVLVLAQYCVEIPPNILHRYFIGGPGGIQNTSSCLDLGLSVPKEHIIDGCDRICSSSRHYLPISISTALGGLKWLELPPHLAEPLLVNLLGLLLRCNPIPTTSDLATTREDRLHGILKTPRQILTLGANPAPLFKAKELTHPKKKDIHNTFSLGEEDSDQENAKVKKPRIKNNDPFDYIQNYFEPPFYASVTDTGEKQMYKCKWCASDYKKGIGTNSNLYKHRDGTLACNPCPARSEAIESGCKLPLTRKEINKKDNNRKVKGSLKNAAFNTLVFNQLLMIWVIRFSLPWSRFDDFLLSVTFNYVRQGIHINSRTWAATEAHLLYLNLQSKVISDLQKLNSKITLIHDIWTTKGNHHTFLGILVGYITTNGIFKIYHLGMKYIASSHKGKLLAVPFANILIKSKLQEKINYRLRFKQLHHGFRGQPTLNQKKQASTPTFCKIISDVLAPILEESKHVEEIVEVTVEDVLVGSDSARQEHYNDDDVLEANEDEDPDSWETPEEGKNPVDTILKKRITSSAVKRSEYITWGKNLKIDAPSLLAGYGIRWNIKYESRDRAFKSCKIIAKLIENERDRQDREDREGGENYYNNMEISRHEWEVVNRLNKILGEFYFVTKKMEGDNSSACLMISEYWKLVSFIKKEIENSVEPEFKTMLLKMLTKTRTYLKEAMRCDAVIIATILNPSFCLSIFKVSFPSHHNSASELIRDIFEVRKVEVDGAPETSLDKSASSDGNQNGSKGHKTKREEVDYFPEAVAEPSNDELTIYLGGKYKLPTEDADQCLEWWKANGKEFPILSLLARDYLACSAMSASVERCFSAAADTCGHDRGSLAAKTIDRSVSSHQWLVQGVEPDGSFEMAQAVITEATEECREPSNVT
ncbi:hypothetical protein MJO29_003814 [Puccinia striiformis f. sp. tritici]|nr:hypothetical protein MJO29_003814 [Puccinia striiformis f. sp. tritici]